MLTGSRAIIASNDKIADIICERLPHRSDHLHPIAIAANVSVAPVDRAAARRQLRQTCGWADDTEAIAFFGFLHLVRGSRPCFRPCVAALVAALTELLRDRPQRQRMAQAGHRFVKSRTWAAIATQHRAIYQSLVLP